MAERVQKTLMTRTPCLLTMVRNVLDQGELWDEGVLTTSSHRKTIFNTSGCMSNMTQLESFSGNNIKAIQTTWEFFREIDVAGNITGYSTRLVAKIIV